MHECSPSIVQDQNRAMTLPSFTAPDRATVLQPPIAIIETLLRSMKQLAKVRLS
jgi:hypothetical protein